MSDFGSIVAGTINDRNSAHFQFEADGTTITFHASDNNELMITFHGKNWAARGDALCRKIMAISQGGDIFKSDSPADAEASYRLVTIAPRYESGTNAHYFALERTANTDTWSSPRELPGSIVHKLKPFLEKFERDAKIVGFEDALRVFGQSAPARSGRQGEQVSAVIRAGLIKGGLSPEEAGELARDIAPGVLAAFARPR